MKICVGEKNMEIHVVVIKQQFSLFKHHYQTGPNDWGKHRKLESFF